MGGHLISVNDIYWLIAQAERVQELEKENKRIRQMKYHEAYEQGKFDTNMKVWYEMPKLEQQNKRCRKVLEFYANKINHLTFIENGKSNIEHDQGEKARKALEGDLE